jgi:uncharacterized membrane protein YccC
MTPIPSALGPSQSPNHYGRRARLIQTWRVFARSSVPALICGLRMAASVCLALYVAFWLQLDNPFWAGASAAAVCQPTLGASLRKGWYRMLGTVLGAAVIVIITGWFVQNRPLFLIAIALWGGICATISTLLRNFAAYAAALASTTAMIIGCDTLGSVGGPDGQTFLLAVTRAAEICIGIVCAGLILVLTDFGGARDRLKAQFVNLLASIQTGLTQTLQTPVVHQAKLQMLRRELTRQLVALDPIADQAIGESSEIRYNFSVLVQASHGMFDALVGWQVIANVLSRQRSDLAIEQAQSMMRLLPDSGAVSAPGLRQVARRTVGLLLSTSTTVPSLRLVLDKMAVTMLGVIRALDGLALLAGTSRRVGIRGGRRRLYVADWLPPLLNGSRAFVTFCAAEAFWITTGWPSGATCIIWAAIPIVLFGHRLDQAYTSAAGFCTGAFIATAIAAVVKFAILPLCGSFASLCLVLASYLIPVGALGSRARQTALFGVLPVSFIALVAPDNVMVYDTAAFYNAALALVAGTVIAALAFLLFPPLSPSTRTRRLLASTLHDLRAIAAGKGPRRSGDWRYRIYARLVALPDSTGLTERAQMTAAVTAGCELIILRKTARILPIGPPLARAFDAFASGHCGEVMDALAVVDRRLEEHLRYDGTYPKRTVRARGSVLALTAILDQHSSYFCMAAHA